jgi:hypothetical protein
MRLVVVEAVVLVETPEVPPEVHHQGELVERAEIPVARVLMVYQIAETEDVGAAVEIRVVIIPDLVPPITFVIPLNLAGHRDWVVAE